MLIKSFFNIITNNMLLLLVIMVKLAIKIQSKLIIFVWFEKSYSAGSFSAFAGPALSGGCRSHRIVIRELATGVW